MKREDWLTSFIHELQRSRPDIPRREAHRVGQLLYGEGEGSASPAAAAKQFAAEWDVWLDAFVEELRQLRPTVNPKLARTIAVVWQTQGTYRDPKEAARQYVKNLPGRLG